ncbi:MAG: ATP-binding cassette domain-containing protein [Chthoniobacterales bacterium]|nr:ATP-binding cassette domain-containing protein [Chthoniobacterales bacterium]
MARALCAPARRVARAQHDPRQLAAARCCSRRKIFPPEAVIRASNLVKSFGPQRVLDGESFEARDGQITLLIGPNGAGKTTTMRLVAGLACPDSGNVEIDGCSAQSDGRRYRALLAFLPQSPAFHPRFTCRQILGFYADLRGVPSERVNEAIVQAGLEDVADKPSGHLSGGLRQRLGLALLLLPEAPVLLLDEPGLSLDPEWRERLQKILHEQARLGRTVLVTTHLLHEWNGQADVCLLCQDGKIQCGVDPHALAFAAAGKGPGTILSGTNEKSSRRSALSAKASAGRPFRAVLAREIRAAFMNRYLQTFTVLALAGGLVSVWMSENLEAVAHLTLQTCLYGIPLFALLLGVSSARMESEEWPVLFSQPVRRSTIFFGKFLASWGVFVLLLAVVFVPGLFVGVTAGSAAAQWIESTALGAVFVALGLCVGVSAGDRVRALVAGLVAWLVLFVIFDLAVAGLAGWPFMQQLPGFWVALLVVNPLDAYRIQALFGLEQIPAETAAKSPLAAWWLDHAHACFFAIAALWTVVLLALTVRRINRMEA